VAARARGVSRRRLGVDLAPLRVSKQYRRLYIAGLITSLGSQATYVTVPYQLKNLTHSTLAVGSLGLAELLPLVVFGLYGGVLADRLNRRRLIISMEFVLMLSTVVLVVNALLDHPLAWVLYVDAFVVAGASSLQRPSIEALNQVFVPHHLQREAAALANIRYTTASIIGPALGGLAAVALGPAAVYVANLVTFSVSLLLLYTRCARRCPASRTTRATWRR
jgi:MFS family permease